MRNSILQELKPYGARLVAVSKTQTIEKITSMYLEGQRIFGENRVQELLEKKEHLPPDIEWHLIGHLQRNKVKSIASFIQMIHSVDSISLVEEIDRQAAKWNRSIPILLQLRIASEETKYGIDVEKIDQFVKELRSKNFTHVTICGVMGMASFVDDEQQIAREFQVLKKTFDHLKSNYFSHDINFRELSMGMSGDYHLALKEGSTLVRIGSLIFGQRSLDHST